MSFQYAGNAFESGRLLHTLVLVGMRNGEEAAPSANPILQCRSALRHARRRGLPVCFLHEKPSCTDRGWIAGLAPTRHDRLFVRRGPSCFDSPYFMEAATGILALAGFLARNAIAATAHDAVRHARTIIFLEDAIIRPPACGGFAQEVLELPRALVQRCQTRRWIETTDPQEKA